MRSTTDLIAELDAERPKFFTVAIAVGFEKETNFVFGNDDLRQRTLDDLVRAGGEPVGLIGIVQQPGEVTGYTRVFTECVEQPWAHEFLGKLMGIFGGLLQLQVKPQKGWVN